MKKNNARIWGNTAQFTNGCFDLPHNNIRSGDKGPHPHNSRVYDFDDTHYHKLSTDWIRFYYELETLKERVQETFDQAIQDGRILVAEDAPKGDRLIFPELALEAVSNTRNGKFYFMLTRDLPKKWFQNKTTLDERKARAKRWLERAYAEIAPIGKRWSGAEICIVMSAKFDLTNNAATDVWKKSEIPNRSESGNIPDGERADINELWKFN